MGAEQVAPEDIPYLDEILNKNCRNGLENNGNEYDEDTGSADIGKELQDKIGKTDSKGQNSKYLKDIGDRRMVKSNGSDDKVEKMNQK